MNVTMCTYCNKEIQTDWYNVCDDCMTNIVEPCKKKHHTKKNIPWIKYKKKVWELTELVAHKIPGIEKRGFRDHHIDHQYSIWQGFHDNIAPEKIADLTNLVMMPYKENMLKGIKCADESSLHTVEQVD